MARWGLLKSLVLLILLVITVTQLLKIGELLDNVFLSLQVVLGALYFIFSILEFFKNNSNKLQFANRFSYLPLTIIARTAIRVCVFTVVTIVLYLSETNLKSMALVILCFSINDLMIFTLRYVNKSYFLVINEDHIYFQIDKQESLFVSRIKEVEFRHEIFYFTLLSNSVRMIELEIINKAERDNFKSALVAWLLKNKVAITLEAKEKLAI